jgi:hypothetical protein
MTYPLTDKFDTIVAPPTVAYTISTASASGPQTLPDRHALVVPIPDRTLDIGLQYRHPLTGCCGQMC